MAQVTVGENEGVESALRRFKRAVSKAGIFSDLKRIRHHETPVEKYKRKAQQRRRSRRRWSVNSSCKSHASLFALFSLSGLIPDRGVKASLCQEETSIKKKNYVWSWFHQDRLSLQQSSHIPGSSSAVAWAIVRLLWIVKGVTPVWASSWSVIQGIKSK